MASIGSKPFAKRPLGCIEYLLARCSISGMSTALAYTWHLESNSPVTADLVHQAAALLQDTMPLLCLHVISGEDGRYYFEVMDSTACTVPFKISSETDWRKAQDEMLKETYNLETGPLWKMCFLPTDCKEPAPREIGRGRSLYKFAVTFGIDHILTDGFTNMTICKQFLKILNEIMDGRQPDKTPATKVYPSLVDLMPKNDMAFGWFDYLAIGKTVWDMMFIKPNILALHYPLIDALPLQTFNVYTDGLSEVETTQLRKRCKAQLTTIHGAFTAAASTATAWMIYSRDKPQGNVRESTVMVEHTVNMRRFCETDEGKNALGMLFSLAIMPVTLSPTKDGPEDLWDAARRTSCQLHTAFDKGEMLKQLRVTNYTVSRMKTDATLKTTLEKSVQQRCFGISNLGDCSGILSGGGKHVQVTDIARAVNLQEGQTVLHYVHTYQGRLRYNLTYNGKRFTPEKAGQYASWTLELLRSLITDMDGTEV